MIPALPPSNVVRAESIRLRKEFGSKNKCSTDIWTSSWNIHLEKIALVGVWCHFPMLWFSQWTGLVEKVLYPGDAF